MTVVLKLKSGLDKLMETNMIEYELSAAKTVTDILTELNFPIERAGAVLIDGRMESKSYKLRGGEIVKVFPANIG